MIVNRTYGTHKNLYIHLFLLTIFGPIYNIWSPVTRPTLCYSEGGQLILVPGRDYYQVLCTLLAQSRLIDVCSSEWFGSKTAHWPSGSMVVGCWCMASLSFCFVVENQIRTAVCPPPPDQK